MLNSLKVLQILASKNEYFEANIRQYEKILSEYSLPSEYFAVRCIFLHQIKYLYANLGEYFEANIKRMMRINGVCEILNIPKYANMK
jgi:hypothetical protein